MKCLTREEFEKCGKLAKIPVELADGVGVYVRMLTAEERSGLEKRFAKVDPTDDPSGFRWSVIQATVIDEAGRQLFGKKDREPVMALAATMIEKLFLACCEMNGLTERAVEELEKNSETSR